MPAGRGTPIARSVANESAAITSAARMDWAPVASPAFTPPRYDSCEHGEVPELQHIEPGITRAEPARSGYSGAKTT